MRLLFLAEAVTLAHVARPIALASGLAAAGHDIAIACAASYSRFASACGLPVLALHSLQPAQFLAALAAGRPVYDDATLVRYVDDDLRLMRAFQPDLVVGDFRLSLSVSARGNGSSSTAFATRPISCTAGAGSTTTPMYFGPLLRLLIGDTSPDTSTSSTTTASLLAPPA